jgi:hypothetical protein
VPTTEPRGPHSFEYLKSFRNGSRLEGGFEFPIFGDAYFTGYGAQLGPYEIINAGAIEHRPGYFRPCIVVRCSAISGEYQPSLERTDTSRYHGGSLTDEIAALISLSLGVRMQAGDVNREFYTFSSPGRPIGWHLKPWPESRPVGEHLQVPSAVKDRLLSPEALALIDRFDRLSTNEANAFLKAARTYQRALWIVEWEPAQAWLLFVSSIEALGAYASGSTALAERLLTEYHPALAEAVTRAGGDQLLQTLSPLLEPLVGSVRKFRGFIESHFPDPPAARPRNAQIPWSIQTIGPMLSKIYAHRSKALHDGTPFPIPMCRPPQSLEESGAAREMPFALAESDLGGVWRVEDTPMHIHVFEHIVRQSILKWWSSRAE